MHPNDPNNIGPSLDEQAAIEADALMAEFADADAAKDFADNWEALLEDRGEIIYVAASAQGRLDPVTARAVVGEFVISRIRVAVERRARHELAQVEHATC